MIITTVGIIELLVPLLLIISVLKGEFKEENKVIYQYCPGYYHIKLWSTFFWTFDFIQYAGSANLIFYAIFTFLILIAANYQKKTPELNNI